MKLKHLIYSALVLTLAGCTDAEPEAVSTGEHSAPMTFSAERPTFDSTDSRSSHTWNDGDRVYIQLSDGTGGYSLGSAVYSSGSWSATWTGALMLNTPTAAIVYYFENAKSSDETSAELTPQTITYADFGAIYTYNGTTLTLQAALAPTVSGVRFRTTADHKDEPLIVGQINHNSKYTTSSGNFTNASSSTNTAGLTFSNEEDGYYYTDYVYSADWTDELDVLSPEAKFTRSLSGINISTPGVRGYMDLPLADNHNGWELGEGRSKNIFYGHPLSTQSFYANGSNNSPYILTIEFLSWETLEGFSNFSITLEGVENIELMNITSASDVYIGYKTSYLIPAGAISIYSYATLRFRYSRINMVDLNITLTTL